MKERVRYKKDKRRETMKNEKIMLAERPKGLPTKDTFRFENEDIKEPSEGEILLKTLYISVDPYMRSRMNDEESYVPPFKLDEPLNGGIIARVEKSQNDAFQEGDIVTGRLPWQRYTTTGGDGLQKIDESIAPLTAYLGVLGLTGLTAYFGLLHIGEPKENETVVVSGAAGAVGMIVGQIAKLKGARVVGIAGSKQKIDYLKEELNFDYVINYKEDNVLASLKEACPNGVDVYFDNVGGSISDDVLSLINKFARIPICGQISQYNKEEAERVPRLQPLLLTKSALMKGFIVGDYADGFKEAVEELGKWVRDGKVKYEENIVEGFENVPDAFLGLFSGDNLGKQLVKVAE
jgi:NADPH-dependent curcumin reductase CurA